MKIQAARKAELYRLEILVSLLAQSDSVSDLMWVVGKPRNVRHSFFLCAISMA